MNHFACWLALLLMPLGSLAQVFGTVDAVNGQVSIVSIDGSTVSPQAGQKLLVGQTVTTQAASELHVVTEDGGFLALRPNSTFTMKRYQASQDNTALIDMSLVRGALRSITGWIGKLNPSGYRVTTSTATIGIRGTDHEVTVVDAGLDGDRAGTYDSVIEGATLVRGPRGEIDVQAGQHGFADREGAESPSLLAERPEFQRRRALLIEERITERKENLRQRVRQVLEANPDAIKAVRERFENLTDEQRDKVRKKLLRRDKDPRRSGN